MKDLNIRKIPGVGRIFEGELNGLGIITCKDVFIKIVDIYISYSEQTADILMEAALGISRNVHELETKEYHQKSFSISETFKVIREKGEFVEAIERVAERLATKVQESK